MDERDLIRRLEELGPPELDAARDRAKLAARVGLSKGPDSRRAFAREGRRWLPRFRRSPRNLGALLACLIVVVLIAVNLPGGAVATWGGRSVDLGRPGNVATLQPLREELDQQTDARGAPAYVIARGPAPDGGHYEFLSYRSDRTGRPCIELDLTKTHSTSSSCGDLEKGPRALRIDSAGNEPVRINGRAGEATHSVTIAVGSATVEASVTQVTRAALNKAGLKRPFKVFVAFPDGAAFEHGGRVTVTSTDADGRVLAVRYLRLPEIATSYSKRCENLRLTGQTRKALRACAR